MRHTNVWLAARLEQPTGFVHRDFHCRNLMVDAAQNPGIIDFQDAVVGPVTYDLVSLYKDCYYQFDRHLVEQIVDRFSSAAGRQGVSCARCADAAMV